MRGCEGGDVVHADEIHHFVVFFVHLFLVGGLVEGRCCGWSSICVFMEG